ncbi:MAG: hypothetical protein PHD48_09215, partial [Alphaproteobacteria bacterium]|nr:hypothetical protein [Alphaproteobacteria bacterium]
MLQLINGPRAQVKAKIVCWNKVPCLIASFQNSTPPQVWQMDLEKLTNYNIKLVEKEEAWALGYTVSDGAFTVIASFD